MLAFQILGWLLFSYIEDNINAVECFTDFNKIATAKLPVVVNETERATLFFQRLENKTNQSTTELQSTAIYFMFHKHFNALPATVAPTKFSIGYDVCKKWYRFSVLTMTTIGKFVTMW